MLADDIAVSGAVPDKTELHHTINALNMERSAYMDRKDYDKAKVMHEAHLKAIDAYHQSIRDKEVKRQGMELARLKKATSMIISKHEKEWDDILNQAELKWQAKRIAIEDKHQLELDELVREIDRREKTKHSPKSSYVRDLLRIEKRLADDHQYDEAKILRKKAQKREDEDRVMFAKQREEYRQKEIARLTDRQQEEVRQLEMHIKNERVMLLRKCQLAHKTLMQKTSNSKADMLHAHTVELQRVASSNVSVPPKQQKILEEKREERLKHGNPHGCLPSQMATYRGSQMLLRTQGKYPLVSLCALYDPDCPSPPTTSGKNLFDTTTFQTQSSKKAVLLNATAN